MRFVYFVQAEETGAIKIGSTGDVSKRIAALRTASPCRLDFLGASAALDERECHRRFAPIRLGGEWFASTPELLDFIATAKDPSIECRQPSIGTAQIFGSSIDDVMAGCAISPATFYRWAKQFREHDYVRDIHGTDLVLLSRVTGLSADVILGMHQERS